MTTTTAKAPRILGRYALHGEIAKGGMATVHVGRIVGAAGFSRTVAIKRLHAHVANDPQFVSMFVDEARLAARIHHPNVVSTLDVVALEGELFVVMEYVQGESLSYLMRAARAVDSVLPLAFVSTVLTGTLEGLHAAHEAVNELGEPLGLVHRDVSPQNVLVGIDGNARVIDFGVAKASGRLQTTHTGQLKGKLSYMAPEQFDAVAIDRRTDIYAASIVAWEALTGQRLFSGNGEGEVLSRILRGATEPPSLYRRDVPSALDAVVMRGLAPDPKDRFPSARAMAQAFEAAVPGAPPRDVGQWVQSTAGDRLRERAKQIAEIESRGSISIDELGGAPPKEKLGGTLKIVARSGSIEPPARPARPAPHAPAPTPPDDEDFGAKTVEDAAPLAMTVSEGRLSSDDLAQTVGTSPEARRVLEAEAAEAARHASPRSPEPSPPPAVRAEPSLPPTARAKPSPPQAVLAKAAQPRAVDDTRRLWGGAAIGIGVALVIVIAFAVARRPSRESSMPLPEETKSQP